MAAPLEIYLYPHPIFSVVCQPVQAVDEEIRLTLQAMLQVLYDEQAIGLGANMLGLRQRLIVVDCQINDQKRPYMMANPIITYRSHETEKAKESSLSLPGIALLIKRSQAVTVEYLNEHNQSCSLEAKGLLARVIQHEMDYLDGRTILDHIPRFKTQYYLQQLAKHR